MRWGFAWSVVAAGACLAVGACGSSGGTNGTSGHEGGPDGNGGSATGGSDGSATGGSDGSATGGASAGGSGGSAGAIDGGGGAAGSSGSQDALLIAAGDIARCQNSASGANCTVNPSGVVAGTLATTALIEKLLAANTLPVGVAALGDNVYECGSAAEFAACYTPSWGNSLIKPLTHPAIGNHEYLAPPGDGSPAHDYFGAAAGSLGKFYYSYNLGAWHIVVLNSNCSKAGGCSTHSPQYQWLTADLAAHPAKCTLAYWHHPLFSSGQEPLSNGTDSSNDVRPLWDALVQAKAEIVLVGHDHDYERFVPMLSDGTQSPNGLVSFVVGTGGANHTPQTRSEPGSVISNFTTFGVLELTLHPDSYDFKFVPVAGSSFTDSGSGTCH